MSLEHPVEFNHDENILSEQRYVVSNIFFIHISIFYLMASTLVLLVAIPGQAHLEVVRRSKRRVLYFEWETFAI